MKNTQNSRTLLSLLSKVSTAVVVLLPTTISYAKPHYAITVVQEAWVSNQTTENSAEPMGCKSELSLSNGASQMTWQGSSDRKPEKILKVSPSETVFATRNTDDGFLNSVTIWLEVKSSNKTQYFPMTEIDMERYELPKMKLSGRTLTVEADTMTIDPNEEDEMLRFPNRPGQTYQTIRVGSVSSEGLGLTKLICNRY